MSNAASMRMIPAGWQKSFLGDLVSISNRAGLPSENPTLPYVGLEHIESETGKLISYGDPADYKSSSYIVDSTQVLYGRLRPYLNKVFIPKETCYASREFVPINLNEDLNQQFLLYRLRSSEFVEFALSLNTGDRPRVKWPQMAGYPLLLPPLLEQEKIVEILDEQLSRLDAAQASVGAVREKAARFRRSLLNSTLNGTIESLGVVEKLPLSDCAEMSLGIMLDKAKGTGAYLTPYLGNINVRWGEFNQTDLKLMDIKPEQMERSLARKGDVVVCEGGEPGRTAVWNNEQPVAIQKALHRVRPFAEMDSKFIGYCLELEFRGVSEHQLFTGTTIKHLPKEKLKTLRIPKPPLQEQEMIVEILEEQLSRLNASLAVAEQIERKSSALRRSLLHAAFTGELTKEWREGVHV